MTDEYENSGPPQDIDAEMSVLGGMLLSKDAIADAADVVGRKDFYRPNHEDIFVAIMALYLRSEPADPVTVCAELAKSGDLERVGGAAYVHNLAHVVPSVSAVAHYAGLVKEKAVLRGLLTAGREITQIVDSGISPADAVQQSRALVDACMELGEGGIFSMAETIDETLTMLTEQPKFIPTPWKSVNERMSGWRPGAQNVIAARPGVGKALSLDTPLPTPTGWTTMGAVQVGDYVLGMDGRPAMVSFATDVMTERECFEVVFSDGARIIADAEHLWLTETRASRRAATPPGNYVFKPDTPQSRDQKWKSEKPSVKTTKEILSTLTTGSDSRLNHSVPAINAIKVRAKRLPVDPYILGYWLGDGDSHDTVITVGKEDHASIVAEVEQVGYFSRSVFAKGCWRVRFSDRPIVCGGDVSVRNRLPHHLRELSVLNNKHIPDIYLRGSAPQRRALLSGLLDSDGCAGNGRVSFEVTSERLASGAMELARSLGYLPRLTTKRVAGRTEASSTSYRVGFVAHDKPFRLERKAGQLRSRSTPGGTRYITSVIPVESVPVRCITVDNEDHMYLAGEGMVPTHNTLVGLQAALDLTQYGNVLFTSMEMGRDELQVRAISQIASVSNRALDRRDLTDVQWQRIADARGNLSRNLFIDDRAMQTPTTIRSAARTVARTGKLVAIVVDYIQLMTGPAGGKADRQQQVTEFSRALKILAKDFDVPVITLSQLNRQSEGRHDKKPQIADMRESGAIEQDADVILLLHRDMEKTPDEMFVAVAKNRHGVTGSATLGFEGHYSRVVERPWMPHQNVLPRVEEPYRRDLD